MITKAVPSGPNCLPLAPAARVPSPSFTTAPLSPYAGVHHSGRSLHSTRRRVSTGVSIRQEPGKREPAAPEHRTADRAPAPFGPTWDPLAAGRPKAVVYSDVRAPPGSHPSDRRERSLAVALALSLAPSGGAPVRHTTPDPAALRRLRGSSPVGRPVVDPAEPTGPPRPAVNTRLTCWFSLNYLVSAEDAQVARRGGGG